MALSNTSQLILDQKKQEQDSQLKNACNMIDVVGWKETRFGEGEKLK